MRCGGFECTVTHSKPLHATCETHTRERTVEVVDRRGRSRVRARASGSKETRHRVCGHALALLRDSPERYPDDVLIRIFLDEKSEAERAGIAWAFENAREALHRDS